VSAPLTGFRPGMMAKRPSIAAAQAEAERRQANIRLLAAEQRARHAMIQALFAERRRRRPLFSPLASLWRSIASGGWE
jgi:hypothetical protein